MRRSLRILVAVAVAVVSLAAPAGATEPADVTLDVDTVINEVDGRFSADPFGPVCPAGDVSDEVIKGVGGQSGRHTILQAVKVFICDDAGGFSAADTFTVRLNVVLYPDFTTTFNWRVTDGTGAFERLHGQGKGTGTPRDFPAKDDVLTGRMHID